VYGRIRMQAHATACVAAPEGAPVVQEPVGVMLSFRGRRQWTGTAKLCTAPARAPLHAFRRVSAASMTGFAPAMQWKHRRCACHRRAARGPCAALPPRVPRGSRGATREAIRAASRKAQDGSSCSRTLQLRVSRHNAHNAPGSRASGPAQALRREIVHGARDPLEIRRSLAAVFRAPGRVCAGLVRCIWNFGIYPAQ
jgi:hypothetical protein